jgi:hypothetical protein
LIERRNKMVRKIVIFIPMFFLCLGLDNCKSPEEPEEPEYEYRNVEVIYTLTESEHTESFPDCYTHLYLEYRLQDPAYRSIEYSFENAWRYGVNVGSLRMTLVEENRYRCNLRVWVQPADYLEKHRVWVEHACWKKISLETLEIEGAYDLEIKEVNDALGMGPNLHFRMSKE